MAGKIRNKVSGKEETISNDLYKSLKANKTMAPRFHFLGLKGSETAPAGVASKEPKPVVKGTGGDGK